MKSVLKKTIAGNNEDWLWAVEHIEEIVSREEVDALTNATKERICRETHGGKCAVAWSGGKDSLVIYDIAKDLGITDSLFVTCNLEFPAFEVWAKEHMPDGCTVINTGNDLNWLNKHPELLFPLTGALCFRWYKSFHRLGMTQYFFDKGLDYLICGHRVHDGNTCGKDGFIRNKNGEVRYNAIYDWPNEAILGYIHYHNLPLPPFYGWVRGYITGTHPWPMRSPVESVQQGFEEVYQIDPSVVYAAAEKLDAAKRFLEVMEK